MRRWVKWRRNRQCSGEQVFTLVMVRAASVHMSVETDSWGFLSECAFLSERLNCWNDEHQLTYWRDFLGVLPFEVHCEQSVRAMVDKADVCLCLIVL